MNSLARFDLTERLRRTALAGLGALPPTCGLPRSIFGKLIRVKR